MGSRPYVVGTGFLFSDGGTDGGRRGGYWNVFDSKDERRDGLHVLAFWSPYLSYRYAHFTVDDGEGAKQFFGDDRVWSQFMLALSVSF